MDIAYLQRIREQQGNPGCFASTRFLVLKLLGFVDPTKRLEDHFNSPWARKSHPNLSHPLRAYWGDPHRGLALNNDFNKYVLPAVINDPSAGVRAKGASGQVTLHKGFQYFHGQTAKADTMLRQLTPLIVGVSIHGTASRDHWIVVCPDPGGSRRTWAINSWGGDAISAVVQLDDDVTLTAPFKVRLPASGLSEGMPLTVIPCGVPMWGYCG